eukprot:1651901-Lingulodinium_polyedra.AAC.1
MLHLPLKGDMLVRSVTKMANAERMQLWNVGQQQSSLAMRFTEHAKVPAHPESTTERTAPGDRREAE